VYGLLVVRNEVDIIRTNVLYHLSLGLDRLLIVDNGSSDGTDRVLRELGEKDPRRVRWTREEGLWRAGDFFTRLAREAYREGADWVVPIDADEFWHAPGGDLRRVLEESEAGALGAPGLNFIQRREQEESSPDALLHMTRRVPEPVAAARGNRKPVAELVESQQIGSVEIEPVRKWISRPTAAIEMFRGNGRVEEVAGLKRVTDGIVRLHAILRSRARLEAKAEGGERSKQAGSKPNQSSHLMRWKRLKDEGLLEQEWAANSYAGDSLNVYGVHRKTVFDPTLRDAVAPFVKNSVHGEEVVEKPPLWGRIMRRAK
jgi:glycosyltransferase involved in cell wall biosynthesis